MKVGSWTIRGAILALIVVVFGIAVSPALAAGPSVGSIYTSVNPARAGQEVTFTVVVRGTFQSPVGVVQLFDGFAPLGGLLVLTPDFDSPPIIGGPKIIPTDHSTATLTASFSPGTHMITLDYSGDGPLGNLPIFGGGVIALVVTGAPSTTTVSSSSNPSVFGQSVTLTASATSSGSPASGSIQFKADGANLGAPQPVNGSGHASVDASTLAVGNHSISAEFTSSSPDVFDSSGSLAGGQTVNPAATATVVSSSGNPSEFGAAVTFTATITVDSPGSGTPSGTVQFQDNGADLGSPQNLGSGGQATIATSSLAVGTHAISASFTSDSANFNNSAGTTSQVVNRARTTLTYDGAGGADFNDPAVLSARLTRSDGATAITWKTVTFTMGSETCSATTDTNGEAACTITPTEAAGPFTVTAVFNGDGNYQSSTDGKPFAVSKEETSTTYTGPTVIAQGYPVTLSGRLLEDGITAIAGRMLTLTLGSGAGAQSCTGLTDTFGNVQCTVTNVTVTQGPNPVKASFAGDGYYLPSVDASQSVIVFAFPSRGIFVLGDQTASGLSPVTFWGSQWTKQNNLSGGIAPSAFKGFADNPSTKPPQCGGTWTSSPGNSSSPVDVVPAYMGTAVSTSVGKNGAAVSGNIVKIVVVMTAPGYAPNPGHAGTGTIIATYC